jgi:hypothetical protein
MNINNRNPLTKTTQWVIIIDLVSCRGSRYRHYGGLRELKISWTIEINDDDGNIAKKLKGKGSVDELAKVVQDLKRDTEANKGGEPIKPTKEVVSIRFPLEMEKKIKKLGYKRSDFVIYCLERFLENPDFLPIKNYPQSKVVHITIPANMTRRIRELKTPTTNIPLTYTQVILRSIERYFSDSAAPPK